MNGSLALGRGESAERQDRRAAMRARGARMVATAHLSDFSGTLATANVVHDFSGYAMWVRGNFSLMFFVT